MILVSDVTFAIEKVFNEKNIECALAYDKWESNYLNPRYDYNDGYISIFNVIGEECGTQVTLSGSLRQPYEIHYCVPSNAQEEDLILLERFIRQVLSEKDFNKVFSKRMDRRLFYSLLNDLDLVSKFEINWSGIPYIRYKGEDTIQSILNLDTNLELMVEIISRFGRLKDE